MERRMVRRPFIGEFVWATAQYESGDWDSAPLVGPNLLDSIARYTAIRVSPTPAVVALASQDVMRFPFVYLTGHLPVRFTNAERDNLRAYLDQGGFLFVDDHNHDVDGVFHKTATEELTRTIGQPHDLPNNHDLYTAFFRFPDGPPTTSHELNGWGDNLVHKNLQAVFVRGRLAVLYSSKDYSSEWGYHPDSKRFYAVDNTRFGVNLVVYALTR
jgi:hypothetical protein